MNAGNINTSDIALNDCILTNSLTDHLTVNVQYPLGLSCKTGRMFPNQLAGSSISTTTVTLCPLSVQYSKSLFTDQQPLPQVELVQYLYG